MSQQSEGRYEVKTVEWREDSGALPVMIMKFSGEGHSILPRADYGEEHYLFIVVSSGNEICSTAPHEVARGVSSRKLRNFLKAVKVGDCPWEEIHDGQRIEGEEYVKRE